jgi:hypothetical protein|tara:strand:+ start:7339 stop:7698 length:360 start_codon:yes stop_codon:yes gene_type:complete
MPNNGRKIIMINKLEWSDSQGSVYRIEKKPQFGIRITSSEQAFELNDAEAVSGFFRAVAILDDTHTKEIPRNIQSNVPDTKGRAIDPSFPNQVRTAMFIMVGIAASILIIEIFRVFGSE